MADERMFVDIPHDEQQLIMEEIKTLKLTCEPKKMTVGALYELIENASDKNNSENIDEQTGSDDEPAEETAITEPKDIENPEGVNSEIENAPENNSDIENDTENMPANTLDKVKKCDGLCISCYSKVYDGVCSGCGRQY